MQLIVSLHQSSTTVQRHLSEQCLSAIRSYEARNVARLEQLIRRIGAYLQRNPTVPNGGIHFTPMGVIYISLLLFTYCPFPAKLHSVQYHHHAGHDKCDSSRPHSSMVLLRALTPQPPFLKR